jgi:hypothetical protein
MTVIASPCATCIHRDAEQWFCKAFPQGIPTVVMFRNPHAKVVRGQVGRFIYEPTPGGPPITDFSKPPSLV